MKNYFAGRKIKRETIKFRKCNVDEEPAMYVTECPICGYFTLYRKRKKFFKCYCGLWFNLKFTLGSLNVLPLPSVSKGIKI